MKLEELLRSPEPSRRTPNEDDLLWALAWGDAPAVADLGPGAENVTADARSSLALPSDR